MGSFSFNGVTIVAPGFILRSTIGVQRVLNLLPFGKLLMVGASDGGVGGGTIYEFTDLNTARQVLRSGALLDALLLAGAVGGASGFAAVVMGTKTNAAATIAGASSASATLTSGDQGVWNNSIQYEISAGSSSGFAFTLQYPDQFGNTVTVGGLGSLYYDNLAAFSDLATVIANDSLLTPGPNTGLTPIVSLTVTKDGVPNNTSGFVPLTGGTGTGEYVNTTVTASPTPTTTSCGVASIANIQVGTVLWIGTAHTTVSAIAGNVLTYTTIGSAPAADAVVSNVSVTDFTAAIDELVDEPFDIGHLVNGYDEASQAYADELSAEVAPLGRLSRWIHQVIPTGTSPTYTKAVNSEAVVNAGVTRAQALDSPRSSVVAQQTQALDPTTGVQEVVDLAPIICGYAALVGATGPNGPFTAMTQDTIPTAIAVTYPILGTNNTYIVPSGSDLDRAILGGLMPFINLTPTGVRCVQSITTAPNDPTGVPWIYAEFSVQRGVDALQANMVAAIASMQPKGLGAGLTVKTAGAIITTMVDVLAAALGAQWLTGYNPSAISFNPYAGDPDSAIVTYDCTPVFPLNHLGIDQTVQPFSISAQQITTAAGAGA